MLILIMNIYQLVLALLGQGYCDIQVSYYPRKIVECGSVDPPLATQYHLHTHCMGIFIGYWV